MTTRKSLLPYFLLLSAIFPISMFAQFSQSLNSSDIFQRIQKLNVLGSVLYVAAHPDDENTRLLAYLSKDQLFRTGYLSLTRGDGGQNLVGDEQGVELGLIRTQELLSARRIDGAEQFFSRAYDFGYSKNVNEAMRIWDHYKILSDVVWVIRKFQPDVIITRFPQDERAGHGHHTASAVFANEAYAAAADPSRFPEQFSFGVKTWQAKRILWNTYNFGGNNTITPDQVKIDVGGFNPLLGKSYGEIASESRSQHKSQGFGVAATRGQQWESFMTTGGDAPKEKLTEGITTNWNRVKGGEAIPKQIDKILKEYSFEHPGHSVQSLVSLYRAVKKIPDGYWKNKKLEEIQQVIEACAGLFADAITTQEAAVRGDSLKINTVFNNRNGVTINLKSANVISENESLGFFGETRELKSNENVNIPFTVFISESMPLSQPYWLQNGLPNGSFIVNNQTLIGNGENAPALIVRALVNIAGEDFEMERPVQYKYTDPVKGELYQPLVIMPALSVQEDPSLIVFAQPKDYSFKVKYKANRTLEKVSVMMQDKEWLEDKSPMQKGEERTYQTMFDIAVKPGSKKDTTFPGTTFTNSFSFENKTPAVYPVTIQYDHVPHITYFKPAQQTVLDVNVKTIKKNIGYVVGAGDKVPQALEQLGFKVTLLSEADLTTGNLKQFDAIFTGIRAYNVHPFLSNKYDVLMDYVNQGGNFIVQFNTNNQFGPVKSKMSPYPFSISRNRVTDETADVTFLLPKHQVLNYPNKITALDFEGWIQERSVYEADNFDSKYEAPLSMSDPGATATNGSLIIGKYGKGNFVYTGLALFRELPAGVPGAYRLLANLIAL